MPRNIYNLSKNKNEPTVTNRKKRQSLYAFSPFVTIKNTVARRNKKGTVRELKVNNNQKKKYPKLWKAATHTSSMTELTRKKINNKKNDADKADQGDSGWVGR